LQSIEAKASVECSQRTMSGSFKEAYLNGRWKSQEKFAEGLGLSAGKTKRLLSKDRICNVKIGDFLRGLRAARIAPERVLPRREKVERAVQTDIVQALQKIRIRSGEEMTIGEVNEGQLDRIFQLSDKIGVVDERCLREPRSWNAWLGNQCAEFANGREPLNRLAPFVVCAGDWLAAREYLPCFAEKLLRLAARLQEVADQLSDKHLMDQVIQFGQYMMQVSEIHRRFWDAQFSTRTVVKRWGGSHDTVVCVLRNLGLDSNDFQDREATVGRSSQIRPLVKDLFARAREHKVWLVP
jgi:hypothetical protein